MEELNNAETIKITVEEFSRLQSYMELTDKNTDAYKLMMKRYRELKVILTSLGVNLTNIDTINE